MHNKKPITVVKIGGNIIDNAQELKQFLADFAKVEGLKVLVHGGGKSATKMAGVFAGGDCVNGGREVVDAVQAGKDGAAAILKYIISPDYMIESELKPTFNN